MKKLSTLFVASLLFLFSACKKDYSCSCSTSTNPIPYSKGEGELHKDTKEKAVSTCNSLAAPYETCHPVYFK